MVCVLLDLYIQYVSVFWMHSHVYPIVGLSNVFVHPIDWSSFGISVGSFSQSLNDKLPGTLRRDGRRRRRRRDRRMRRWWRRDRRWRRDGGKRRYKRRWR